MLSLIIPTYGHLDYAIQAAKSAEDTVEGCEPIIIDDGFSAASQPYSDLLSLKNTTYIRFAVNQGLTACWNYGLQFAIGRGATEVCVTNDDVIFSPGWFSPVRRLLEAGIALVGPLTNAPGTEAHQDVRKHLKRYEASDQPEDIAAVADNLRRIWTGNWQTAPLNGFCMVATAEKWKEGSFSSKFVFKPRNDFNSKGQPNPTPLMTLNEYELQRRWADKGWKTAVVFDSFVFHYRSLTRGLRYAKNQEFRK